MTQTELIDRLCSVVEKQAQIIKEQALFIEEQLAVDEAVKEGFSKKREAVDDELDIIEYGLRPFCNTGERR